MLMNDGIALDSVRYYDLSEKVELPLSSQFNDSVSHYFVMRFNEYDCEACVEYAYQKMVEVFANEKDVDIMVIKNMVANQQSTSMELAYGKNTINVKVKNSAGVTTTYAITVTRKDNRNYKRDYAITTLFLNCGMRLSELCSIQIDKIKGDTLTIIGKGNKERTVYLNKSCMIAISDYLSSRPPQNSIKRDSKNSEKALFLSEQKQRISNRTVQAIISKELKLAGLDAKNLSVHKLRHTAATLMYQYGNVDIRALQELLGHESISTTEIYTHVNNEQVRNAVELNPLNQQ